MSDQDKGKTLDLRGATEVDPNNVSGIICPFKSAPLALMQPMRTPDGRQSMGTAVVDGGMNCRRDCRFYCTSGPSKDDSCYLLLASQRIASLPLELEDLITTTHKLINRPAPDPTKPEPRDDDLKNLTLRDYAP